MVVHDSSDIVLEVSAVAILAVVRVLILMGMWCCIVSYSEKD